MRPVLAGVLAGILVSMLALGVFLASLPPGPISRVTPPPPPTLPPIPTASPSPLGSPSSTPAPIPSPSPTESPEIGLRVGDQAPPLSVARLGGGQLDRTQFAGTPLWVNFTATWCPTCRDELRLLERYQASLKGKLNVVVIDVREPQEAIAALVRELRLTLPVGLDESGTAQRDWAAFVLPVHYWLDAGGRIRAFVYGGAGPEQFATGLRSVLPNEQIDLEP
jgi:cytochrome c biogenesis protein CcmG, thiol:disulfide interchange protein DsbE